MSGSNSISTHSRHSMDGSSSSSDPLNEIIGEFYKAQADSVKICRDSRFNRSVPESTSCKPINPKIYFENVKVLLKDSQSSEIEKLRKIYENIFLFAGRTSQNPGFCCICLNKGSLANSHIIPNNILSSFGTTFMLAQTPNEIRSANNLAWKLFCKPNCEVERLSKLGENGFANIFHKFIEDVVEGRNNGKSALLVTTDQSIHYCIASIIFRYIVVSGKRDLELFIKEYGEKVEEAFWNLFFLLRNYVLDKDHQPRPHIELFINEEEFNKKTMLTSICTTYPTDLQECFTTAHFSFKGFHFLVVESCKFREANKELLDLPENGFSHVITFDPQKIEVKKEHVLKLPRAVIRALEFDSIVYQKMLKKVNACFLGSQTNPQDPELKLLLPQHQLINPKESYLKSNYIIRLPDEIIFKRQSDGSGILNFNNPEKYELLFWQTKEVSQVWLVRNILAKQTYAIINCFCAIYNTVFGFFLDEKHLEKSDFKGLKKNLGEKNREDLRKFLVMTPISKTDHKGIEWITNDYENNLLIASSIVHYWLKNLHQLNKLPLNALRATYQGKLFHFIDLKPFNDQESHLRSLGMNSEQMKDILLNKAEDKIVMDWLTPREKETVADAITRKLEEVENVASLEKKFIDFFTTIAHCLGLKINIWVADVIKPETVILAKEIGNNDVESELTHHILYDQESRTYHKLDSVEPTLNPEEENQSILLSIDYLKYSLKLGAKQELGL